MTSDHLDALAVFLVGILLLAFVEMRLRSLFARHEVREEKMHAASALLADAAAAVSREASRHVAELRLEATAIRLDVANLSELLRGHEARLVAAEQRLTRAAMVVPRRPDGDAT